MGRAAGLVELTLVLWCAMLMLGAVSAEEHTKIPLPSYHYGAKIPVSCLNRSM